MQNTLKYVSIQHELGMAIGMALRLHPMLSAFSRVTLRRLGLAAIHFHFVQRHDDLSPADGSAGNPTLTHYLSVPHNASMTPIPDLAALDGNRVECVHRLEHGTEADSHFYSFNLGRIGIITLQRMQTGLEQPIIELLKPLMARLGVSCRASLEHEELLVAVAARHKAEETILFQLRHDDLTHLPNRRQLMQTLEEMRATEIANQSLGALLFLDLDRFKMVNDTLGHSVGDRLLVEVARKLERVVGERGIVHRLSGDEFVILLGNLGGDLEQARSRVNHLLEEIRAEFSDSMIAGEHRLHVTPSTGIELFPDGDCSAEQILRRADTAMYQAKLAGLNSSVYYDRQLSSDLERRREIEKDLQSALKDTAQFELHYQTQHDLDGSCIGAEALLRWHRPGRELLATDLFVSIAEETGLMLDLGRWVIDRACEDIRQLQTRALPPTFRRISINISAVQFNHADFVETLLGAIERHEVDAQLVAIELTEGALIRNHHGAAAKMALLHEHGIEVAVDDFGTGYSSLAYLSQLPVETIKIDQSFVRDIDSDSGNQAIVGTIIALGRALDIDLIAEGVETESERATLQRIGCTQYQGFLFSRPVPLATLIDAWLGKQCA